MKLTQQSRQGLTQSLHQALKIMQMSQLELGELIEAEIEKNPLLDQGVRKSPFSHFEIPETLLAAKPSLRDFLLQQAREQFEDKRDLAIATDLIDQLDERGFFCGSLNLEEEKILKVMQAFDPPGICSRTLQECFLKQLPDSSLARVLVRDHFQSFLHGKFFEIRKKMHIAQEKMQEILEEISHLSARPSSQFENFEAPLIMADLVIKKRDQDWFLEIGDEEFFVIPIRSDVLGLLSQAKKEEKKTVRKWFRSAKELQQALLRRKKLLLAIGQILIRTQIPYFSQEGEPFPLSIRELAEELKVHPTTAWRAVANKTLASPRGMIALNTFFSNEGSKNSIREMLKKMILQEDRFNPLSDEDLVRKLREQGVRCARRTVAHYRNSLKLRASTKRLHI